MRWNTWFFLASLLAGLGVMAGAFGAHGLQDRLTAKDLNTYEVAVRYQMYHALGLFAVAWLASHGATAAGSVAGWSFLLGIVLFSGSLYVLVFTGLRWLGMITPLGGVAFLIGWAALAVAAWKAA